MSSFNRWPRFCTTTVTTVSLALTLSISPAWAVTKTKAPVVPTAAERLASLHQRLDQEIDRRITSLTELEAKLAQIKRLTPPQQTQFRQDLDQEIASLAALKVKADAETEAVGLRGDAQQVVQQYRVYAVYLPKIQLLASADAMLTAADTLSTLDAALQTRLTQQAGQDVTAQQALLADMQAKLTTTTSKAAEAVSILMTVTPEGYPSNKTQLMAARSDLQTANVEVHQAAKDAHQLVAFLKGERLQSSGSASLSGNSSAAIQSTISATPSAQSKH